MKTTATFNTRKEAQEIVAALDSRQYMLSHGEYARPDYTVRKVRGQDRFYIHVQHFYYRGTFGAPKDGGLDWESAQVFARM